MGWRKMESEGQHLSTQCQALFQALAVCYFLNPPAAWGVGMMSLCFQKRIEYQQR